VAAQLLSLRPATTPAELRQALRSTGRSIVDARNGIARRRINAVDAYEYLTTGGSSGDYTYWIPAVTHASGAAGSQWRSDAGTLNRGAGQANLNFTLYTASQTYAGTGVISGYYQAVWEDIVGQFGVNGSGALKIESDQPLKVTSRVFNQAPGGTFGQYIDGYTTGDGLSSGQEVWLPQLAQNSNFRTNIGFANMGASTATVTVTLYLYNAVSLGSFNVTIPAGQWAQENEPFRNRYGRTNVTGGYAKIRVSSGSGVLAYASVVDSNTNDPTTIPMKP
jgi:hypothetical protein